jgi:CrcB protein
MAPTQVRDNDGWEVPLRHAVVFVGGTFGAASRWAVGLALAPASPSAFPLATFVVNVSGAFGLGFAAVLLIERLAPTRYLRNLIGIGFFGAYTTFSTMAMDGVRLVDNGHLTTAVIYWVLTLIVGQMAGVYGMWLGRADLLTRRGDESERRGQAVADIHRRVG